jgi:hypothetical protein
MDLFFPFIYEKENQEPQLEQISLIIEQEQVFPKTQEPNNEHIIIINILDRPENS